MIYWADDNGDFDINRRTVVAASFNGDDSLTFGFGHWIGPLYVAFLTSDTVEDIIFFGETNWKSSDTATFHFLHFAGGEALYKPGDTVFETASYELGEISKNSNTSYQERLGSKGKFSGGNREDFISSDWYGNMFFYKNVAPFNLNSFGDALCFDTLFSIQDNPTLTEGSYSHKHKRFSMRALPKLAGDSSVDFMPNLNVNENDDTVYIFRGGPHFGLNRLTLDSAEIVIRPPGFHNSTFKNFNISPFFSDCGDMTGTGNPVAKRNMALGHGSGYDLYYVLGRAVDDKADIVYSHALYPTSYSIQVDADGDKFQDIVFQAFSQYNGSDPTKGGLWVLHGTNKIPVKLNPKYSVEEDAYRGLDDQDLKFFPNPAGIQTQLDLKDFDLGRYKVVLRDILGRNIKEFEFDHFRNYESLPLSLTDLQNGTYYLTLTSDNKIRKGMVIIQH